MSIWTHISGSVDLEKYPYERNKKGELFLPYKTEQVSLGVPMPRQDSDGELGLGFEIDVTSHPIIRHIVEKDIKLIPSGETEVIEHFINKTNGHRSSCSAFICKDEEKQFQKLIMDKYRDKLWSSAKWDDYQSYLNIKLDFINNQKNTILTITDDVRGCTALDMLKGILNFVKNLMNKQIDFNKGYLYWQDDIGGKCSVNFNCHSNTIYVVYQNGMEATLVIDKNIIKHSDGSFASEIEVKTSDNWFKSTGISISMFV